MGVLISKPGITNATAGQAVPATWSASWFQTFITNYLTGADVRNAVGSGGVAISGNLTAPYATVGFAAPITLPSPVTITAPASAATALTITGYPAQTAVQITDASTGSQEGSALKLIRAGSTANSLSLGPNITLEDSTNSTYVEIKEAAGQLETWCYNATSGWAEILVVGGANSGGSLITGIGVGAPLNNWEQFYTCQLGPRGAVCSFGSTGNNTDVVYNAYWNGSAWVAVATDECGLLALGNSGLEYASVSGTAGSGITFVEQFLVTDAGAVSMPNLGTGSGTELEWVSGGSIVRASSSRRYKTDIETISYDDAKKVLELRPVIYTETASQARLYGLIAEEVYDVLPNLVHCDADVLVGAHLAGITRVPATFGDKRPESVHYKHLTAVMLKVMQNQEARIHALEEKVRV